MEGIAGMIGANDRSLVGHMLKRLRHRGPGLSAVYADDWAMLGARCPADHPGPPIAAAEGIAAASDSYLFNKEFLRRTIVPGADPDASDAELFLRMYGSIGLRMFNYVDGAYAVAIVDGRRTILARDPYGIKPLYVSTGNGPTIYSSEMKSQILTGGEFAPFPPGTCLVSGEGVKTIAMQELPWADGSLPKSPEERLRHLLDRSVAECVSGHRAVNVLLSGGVDSSVIAASAAQVAKRVATACVGTDDSEDLRMARVVAERLGTDHREKVFDKEEMLEILEEVIYAAESFDYPLIRSCIPNLMAVRLFKDKGRVTLVGEGGDELFAGYESLRAARSEAKLRRMRVELLNGSHWTGFQRVDRMTSSASLDGRMPMMSDAIVSFALGLGPKDLLGPRGANTKFVLRRAYEDLLPKEIAWRRKRKFSDGAGSMGIIAAEAERAVSDRRFETRSRLLGGKSVRTKEEMLYFEIFRKHFPSASALYAVGFTRTP